MVSDFFRIFVLPRDVATSTKVTTAFKEPRKTDLTLEVDQDQNQHVQLNTDGVRSWAFAGRAHLRQRL